MQKHLQNGKAVCIFTLFDMCHTYIFMHGNQEAQSSHKERILLEPDEGSCGYKMPYNKNTFRVNLSMDVGQSNYYKLMTIMESFQKGCSEAHVKLLYGKIVT